MALPSSGQISTEDINIELGRDADAQCDITGTDERALAGVPTGQIILPDDFWGASSAPEFNWPDVQEWPSYLIGYPEQFVSLDINGTTFMGSETGSSTSLFPWTTDPDERCQIMISSVDAVANLNKRTQTGGFGAAITLGAWYTLSSGMRGFVIGRQSSVVQATVLMHIRQSSDTSNVDSCLFEFDPY